MLIYIIYQYYQKLGLNSNTTTLLGTHKNDSYSEASVCVCVCVSVNLSVWCVCVSVYPILALGTGPKP